MRSLVVLLCACAAAGCGPWTDGEVDLEIAVSGLAADQHFCFTWELFQPGEDGRWAVIDEGARPVCAAPGSDRHASVGNCHAGARYFVAYQVRFLRDAEVLGVAAGISGGTPADVCVRDAALRSTVIFQFGNEGTAGAHAVHPAS